MEMNKQFEYRGHTFNIKVELHTKAERHVGGAIYHKVITQSTDNNDYYHSDEVIDKFLVFQVESSIKSAQKYVDEKIDGIKTPNQLLTDLGFK